MCEKYCMMLFATNDGKCCTFGISLRPLKETGVLKNQCTSSKLQDRCFSITLRHDVPNYNNVSFHMQMYPAEAV